MDSIGMGDAWTTISQHLIPKKKGKVFVHCTCVYMGNGN
jgi:hypothetical protein